MTMARTIIQEQAPEGQRGRIMAFHSFSFIGSGPIGALFCGFLVEQVGPKSALIVASGLMLVVMLALTFFTGLWQLDAKKVNPRSMTSSVNND